MNTALILRYDGTAYHGWQSQKNAVTVQDTVEGAIAKTTGLFTRISGCGRTDAGVHAKRYVANFRGRHPIPTEKLHLALNSRLPGDIAVYSAHLVDEDFDARFSCKKKEYTYLIARGGVRDPFERGRVFRNPESLDISAMSAAARRFEGKRDFAAMRSEGSPVKSTVRTVYYCELECAGNMIKIRICADGFLYNMVRTISGTILLCGRKKLAPGDVEGILESRDRTAAGMTLPACGLYLTRLWYDEEALCKARENEE